MLNTVSQLCLLPGIFEAQLGDAKKVCWVSNSGVSPYLKSSASWATPLNFAPQTDSRRSLRRGVVSRRISLHSTPRTTRIRMDLLPLINVAAPSPLLYYAIPKAQRSGALVPTLAQNIHFLASPISPLVMADGADMADTFNHVTSRFPFAKSRPQVRDE